MQWSDTKKQPNKEILRLDLSLERCISQGRSGLSQADTGAVKWYRLAAGQGDAAAQYNLGVMYEKGSEGLPKSDAETVKWYKLASDLGNSFAKEALLRLQGKGAKEAGSS